MEQKAFKRPFVHLFYIFFLSHLVLCQLDYRFYDSTCPSLTRIVRYGVWSAIANDTRMAASLVRLQFHDCFVNVIKLFSGCDASILLDDIDSTFVGEKTARSNQNSLRGYEVIDKIKANVEKACPSTVSCTDILILAAREAANIAGASYWMVPLGRRDGRTANKTAANELPSPFESLDNIIAKFNAKGLDTKDVVVLSGMLSFNAIIINLLIILLFNFGGSGKPDPDLEASLLKGLQTVCPDQVDSDTTLVPLDSVTTNRFDNSYYRNLVNSSGLLQSDHVLSTDNRTASMVLSYSRYPYLFLKDFGASMVKMANIGVLTGQDGEIRKNCKVVN
ncbi:peroxidase 10-like [Gossypium australe]|uniref:Peroxidase n=1 Tax=Gossypium australe TaxID=47621 RepID=A0A5B6UU53_9ROSI|nr:peroxidase 10-like [Gossypium australe]